MLRITVTCLSTSTLDYFDVNTTPGMPISKAVRISSTIPLLFSAVKYENKHYVDGAVLRNLPIKAFPDLVTLFFKFKNYSIPFESNKKNTKNKHKLNNIGKFLLSLLDVTVTHSNQLAIKNG